MIVVWKWLFYNYYYNHLDDFSSLFNSIIHSFYANHIRATPKVPVSMSTNVTFLFYVYFRLWQRFQICTASLSVVY